MRPTRFYLGVFLLTCSTLMIEIIQTRLLSVVTWYHLAFFVISSAMFGMTAGAVWIYLRRDRFTADTLSADLTALTSAFAVTTALSLAFQLTLAATLVVSASTAVVFAELALAMAVPFFFSGAAVSLALTRSPYPIGLVYAVDLAGAAVGCLGVLTLLDFTDAPSAILLAGAGAAGAAALFRGTGIGRASHRRGMLTGISQKPLFLFVALIALGIANGATRHGLQPILVKGKTEERHGEFLYEKWNSFSRVSAASPVTGPPFLWGPSEKLPENVSAEQIHMTIDGIAGTRMVRFDGDLSKVAFLAYDVTNLAYSLPSTGRAAVIGVGSGRDVLSAIRFGYRDVTGVEINPIFIDLLVHREPFAGFAGLSSANGVRFVVDEARSWLTRTEDRFDLLQMSMIDTWAATGAGAFTLTENGLYTLEAWTTFMNRLTEDGIFTVSRWHAKGEVNETGRMVSLAVASLMEAGASDPSRHLFLASSGHVATLLLSRSPLSAERATVLHRTCEEYGYNVLLSPRSKPASPVLGRIVNAAGPAELHRETSSMELDLTPPNDERPFFFNLLPLTKPYLAVKYLRGGEGVVRGNVIAGLTLVVILVISLALVSVTVLAPLAPAVREVGQDLAVGGTVYFALLGLGFMFAEIGLLQRLSVFLGHPIYSLSVVLFSLILASGVGSFLSQRVRLNTSKRFIVWAALIGGYLLILPFWLPEALRALQTSGLWARAILCVAVIAPAGILMGLGFPTGMRLVQAKDERPTPWFWGINGAAGVLASVLAIVLSIGFGIHLTLTVAGICYLATIPAAFLLGLGPRVREGSA